VTDFSLTSLESTAYNCVAWAAGESDRAWWPDSQDTAYWPEGVPRETTVAAFVAAFQTLGYELCAEGSLEEGIEKIALYTLNGKPTHVARQLSSGRWTSKLGKWVDIEHATPESVLNFPNCRIYGEPTQYMKRCGGNST
jgi:hypothetical protein